MTKLTVALVEASSGSTHVYSKTYLPRVGIPTLGAILKKMGIACDMWFQAISALDREQLKKYDIVGIGSITNTITDAYQLADYLRQHGVKVVMGGPHVTFMPEEALQHCDYVVLGEGDASFPALIAELANGGAVQSVPGLALRDSGGDIQITGKSVAVDFEELPSPDFSRCPQFKSGKIPPIIVTSRGCPHDCIFCSVTTIFGRKYRFKRNQQVIDEIRPVQHRSICFGDDNFCANPKRTKSLLKDMIDQDAVPLRWAGQMCVAAGEDLELLDMMQKTRCRTIYVGIESINPETLKKFGKVHEHAATARCIENLHRHDIGIHGMFVVDQDDDPQSVKKTIDYAIENDMDMLQIMTLTPFPGTAAYDQLKGQLLHSNWEYFDGLHLVMEPKKCTAYDLQTAVIREMQRFYSLKRALGAYRKNRGWRMKYRLGAYYILQKWFKENSEYIERLRTNFYQNGLNSLQTTGARP
jgi:radical SAM superfamily enzyme YgiQ (UPF0313 family)